MNRQCLARMRFFGVGSLVIVSVLALSLISAKAKAVETPFGAIAPSSIIERLIKSPIIQRLKAIDQQGPLYLFGLAPRYSRYEHSVGVWSLLARFQRPMKEQAAGLLHDASHTVFSHVGDSIFYESNVEDSYQDRIHLQFLQLQKIKNYLPPEGLSLEDLNPDQPSYRALEQHAPELCADRIESHLHSAVIYGNLTPEEVETVVSDLRFENGQWYFVNAESAAKLANNSLFFVEHLWASSWNLVLYEYFAEMLRYSVERGYITADDIKYGSDVPVFERLQRIQDRYIQKRLADSANIFQTYTLVSSDQPHDYNLKAKFRGVDPWVKTPEGFVRLTTLDARFKENYLRVKARCAQGYKVKLLNNYTQMPVTVPVKAELPLGVISTVGHRTPLRVLH